MRISPYRASQALLNETCRTATVKAAKKSTVLVLSKDLSIGVEISFAFEKS